MTDNNFGIDYSNADAQNETTKGGAKRESKIHTKEARGPALVRFVSYLETGEEEDMFKPDTPKDGIQLGFEVVSPRHTTLVEREEKDGGDFTVTENITCYVKRGYNKKAALVNLFQRMTYGRTDITHFAQMLGEGFLVTLFEKTDKEGVPTKKAANVFYDGWDAIYEIGAPVVVDPIANTETPVEVPAGKREPSCFIWDQPNQAMWDSIQIGDKAEDDEKNFFKNKIKSAINFEGSPVEAFLLGADNIVLSEPEVKEEQEDKPVKAKATKASKPKSTKSESAEVEVDPLAALGLV